MLFFLAYLVEAYTVALCRNFFRPQKPVSEAQELVNHVQRASIVAGECGENSLKSMERHQSYGQLNAI